MPDPTTPTPSPTMNTPHRATPEQWAQQESWAPNDTDSSCLLELRARVEALEAAANDRQHGEAAERAESGPAASLVDRVAIIIANWSSVARPGNDATPTARAAIREVAAWLNERDSKVLFETNRREPPIVDEAIGWLRDEADR